MRQAGRGKEEEPSELLYFKGLQEPDSRHTIGEKTDPLLKLDNALAVRETVALVVADVFAGNMDPRIAAAMGTLFEPAAAGDSDNRSGVATRGT